MFKLKLRAMRKQAFWVLSYVGLVGLTLAFVNQRRGSEAQSSSASGSSSLNSIEQQQHRRQQQQQQHRQQQLHHQQQLLMPLVKEWQEAEKQANNPFSSTAVLLPVAEDSLWSKQRGPAMKSNGGNMNDENTYYPRSPPRPQYQRQSRNGASYKRTPQKQQQPVGKAHHQKSPAPTPSANALVRIVRGNRAYDVAQIGKSLNFD